MASNLPLVAATSRTPNASPRLGATPTPQGTKFALWSTRASVAHVQIMADEERVLRTERLDSLGDGLFSKTVADVLPGALYKLVLDDRVLPDPYARFLPFGVHGPARVVASRRARDAVDAFRPQPFSSWVIYEIHIGTFTAEGTYRAAATKLEALRDLGINAIELMPLSSFAGKRGWGYDGVAHFAPFAPYGEPDDLRAFITHAHSLGIAVILDVVYNHFGPAGSYLASYSPEYFTHAHTTPWGDSLDYANPYVRRYVTDNARHWFDEFGFDGLRLDATHHIHDDSNAHIIGELTALAKSAQDGLERPRVVMIEDDRNDPRFVTDRGVDAIWADDFHHSVRVVLGGDRDGYFAAYTNDVSELARTITRGWLYEGQPYSPTHAPRGRTAEALDARSFVYCVQNHDQIGNRALGTRLHHEAGIEKLAIASTLLLYLPMTPLLFMGQEWAASSPFLFFTDHEPELGAKVSAGRRAEFENFRAFADEEARAKIPDPQAVTTFERSKLDWSERSEGPHQRMLDLTQTLLTLRRADPVLSVSTREGLTCVAKDRVLAVLRRWNGQERLLLVNFSDTPAARFIPSEARASSWETIFQTDEVTRGASSAAPDRGEGKGPLGEALAPWSAVILGSTR